MIYLFFICGKNSQYNKLIQMIVGSN